MAGHWYILIGLWPIVFVVVWAIRNSLRDSKNEVVGIKSVNWPETIGIILSSQADWGHLEVQFRYSVEAKSYVGKYEVGLTPIVPDRSVGGAQRMIAWEKETSELVASYPVGSKVIVHYNPERPEESVLYCSAEPVSHETSDAPQFRFLDNG